MNKIILHRGNTLKGNENSLEAMNPDIADMKKYVDTNINVDNINVVFEVDIIAKYPFIVHHTTEDIVNNVFDVNKNICYDFTEFDSIKNKKVSQLKAEHINKCYQKQTTSKPMILRELLELSKQNNFKLYLDIKVPNYSWYKLLIGYFITIYNVVRMCKLINNYVKHNIIDCIISFNFFTSLIIKIFTVVNNIFSPNKIFIQGIFCERHFKNNFVNKIYYRLLKWIISPKIISYNIQLL